ncbi:unnamed protein product [Blepharisma stoltei]|uniref:EF-hand domain-containing protein n=1 Tax=Blepharisma stoltei TaxID=1481888 RepID=A0AAU9K910_9CILI|nr:unnamed protein product [Blepharisma stoltei]
MGTIYELLVTGNSLADVTKRLFENVDSDGSGFVDESELRVVLEHVYAEAGLDPPNNEVVHEKFRDLDIDGNGEVSMVELEKYVKELLGFE